MNTIDANRILDEVRDGADYSEAVITKALFMTGEISEHEFGRMEGRVRGPGMDSPIQEAGIGVRAERSPGMVG